ncbi:MAG: S8 family serine peptidase [Candidatus Sumerlaeia bacterium]|nr:S8 family serine peptidase [Candidatus Sumerlaeia bacterium]
MPLRKSPIHAAFLACLLAGGVVPSSAQAGSDELAARLEAEAARRAAEVEAFSARTGIPVRIQDEGGAVAGLDRILPGRAPMFLVTHNVNSAISTNAHQVRGNPAFLSVDGTGVTVGVWDDGIVRGTHQEFDPPSGPSRVTVIDGASILSNHGTHMAGTLAAAGVDPNALGMAPGSLVWTADFFDDVSEVALVAADAPGQTNRLYHSNHSYGFVAGWATGNFGAGFGRYWMGTWGQAEDTGFGFYDSSARDLDELAFSNPYYLHFKAAGNDRLDGPPAPGGVFFRWDPVASAWTPENYNPAVHPGSDGNSGTGYDSISFNGIAKNIVTVGAVADAVLNGERDLPSAVNLGLSSWGPADDGRLKPDVVGNGLFVYSSMAVFDADYSNGSGTSTATPNVAGTASLLIDFYRRRFPGGDMLASTLKGLIIHTADDIGPAGPDYQNGFGLVNGLAAAQQIQAHADEPNDLFMREDSLTDATDTVDDFLFIWDGSSPIVATICWTDPAGVPLDASGGPDQSTRQLVNDLDISIIGPDSTVYRQWRLDGTNPSALATTGDNDVDNVRQVRIDAPAGATSGWTLRVESDGPILNGPQVYSIFLSGQSGLLEPAGVKSWQNYR